jgi:2-polyprenyl-3-methyl-5-hydroxy-6-metoxy-1,4-benzoquinol methylase
MSFIIYYINNPILKHYKFEKSSLQFIKKRLQYFFPNNILKFLPLETEDALYENFEQTSNGLVVVINLLDPLLDIDLLKKMILAAKEKNVRVKSFGQVPGTGALMVASGMAIKQRWPFYSVYSSKQRKYNTQCNLRRGKRIKIFKSLLTHFDNLHTISIDELLHFCQTKKGVSFILSYGTEEKMIYLKECPLCHSKSFTALHSDIGQPVVGFLTRNSKYYFLCNDCGLVFLNPVMPDEKLANYYDKYSYEDTYESLQELEGLHDNITHLTTSHFYNYKAVLPYFEKLNINASIIDLGGGNGEFSVYIKEQFPEFRMVLYDYRVSQYLNQALIKRDIETKQADFLNEPLGEEKFDVVTNWEVIEHLPVAKLELYFKKLHKLLKKDGLYILSTPDYNSPYTHALDFWSMAAGEHLSVLSRNVLEPLLEKCGFKIIGEHHECVTMKTADRWFTYGAENSAFFASQGEETIINDFLKNESVLDKHLQFLRKNNLGTEIILCCKKI